MNVEVIQIIKLFIAHVASVALVKGEVIVVSKPVTVMAPVASSPRVAAKSKLAFGALVVLVRAVRLLMLQGFRNAGEQLLAELALR